ncbi:MAG: PqiC family protein [Myxococcota bacterium]
MKHLLPRVLLLLLFGCGSSPHQNFYTLYSEPDDEATGDVALEIEIRRLGLPGYLDRPNLVRRGEGGRLDISGTDRWGTDLDDMVVATLAQNLTQRLPRSTVYTESGAISSRPNVVVEVDLQRFEAADGVVRLDAQVALHWAGGSEAHIERHELTEEPDGDGTEATVAAMSKLLAKLSEAIAGSIAAMAAAQTQA